MGSMWNDSKFEMQQELIMTQIIATPIIYDTTLTLVVFLPTVCFIAPLIAALKAHKANASARFFSSASYNIIHQ